MVFISEATLYFILSVRLGVSPLLFGGTVIFVAALIIDNMILSDIPTYLYNFNLLSTIEDIYVQGWGKRDFYPHQTLKLLILPPLKPSKPLISSPLKRESLDVPDKI